MEREGNIHKPRQEGDIQKEKSLLSPEMANLIASVGNHEAKMLIVGAMRQGRVYTRGDLYRMSIEIQGNKPGWKMSRFLPFQYCIKSLSPIGLVTLEVMDSDLNTYGYALTPYGEIVGKALAGYLISWSLRHDFSLIDMLASAQSPSSSQESQHGEYKKRAPESRAKILYSVSSSVSTPIRRIDIINDTLIEESIIRTHLQELAWKGVIGYEAVKHDSPYALYRLSNLDKEPQQVRRYKSLTQEVYQILKDTEEVIYLSIEEITQMLCNKDERYRNLNQKSLRGRISFILADLERQGISERLKFKGRAFLSEVTLNLRQKEAIVSLVSLIDSFNKKLNYVSSQVASNDRQNEVALIAAESEFFKYGRDMLEAILANQQAVSALFAKAKEHSQHAKPSPTAETRADILSIISDNPSSTYDFIQTELETRYGKKLSKYRVQALLKSLSDQGEVDSETIKNFKHYSLPSGE